MKVASVLRGMALFVIVGSCGATGTDPVGSATRTYRMGFSDLPPRLTIPEVLQTIDSISVHGDAALMVVDVPWAALLADSSPSFLIRRDQYPVALRFQQRGLPLVATIEPANGLDRKAESDVLVKLGRSIAEPAVQRVYREYAVAFDSILHPTYLTLAVETNLIRLLAPATMYNTLVTMTNAGAQQIRATGSTTKLMVSVQVDAAWGRIGTGSYIGVDRDRADFPFVQAQGDQTFGGCLRLALDALVTQPVARVLVHVDGDQRKGLVAPAVEVFAQLGQAVAAHGARRRPIKHDGHFAAYAVFGELVTVGAKGMQVQHDGARSSSCRFCGCSLGVCETCATGGHGDEARDEDVHGAWSAQKDQSLQRK